MDLEIQIPKIIHQQNDQKMVHQQLQQPSNYRETKYRWIIIALTGMTLLLNGLVNNAIAPLQHKMTLIYGISSGKVTASVILSFVVFFAFNFPANQIMDSRGMRISFIIGTSLYFIGTFFYVLINKSYNFVIVGTFLIGAGQPFLINSPAKVAAFWFFPQNRTFATALMVGVNLFGMGIGFLIPTLVVKQQSFGEEAQSQIGNLFIGYLIYAGCCLLLVFFFMKKKPTISPSQGADAKKFSSIRQTFQHVKSDKNLWKFFPAYCLSYGTLITFGANSNFIIKPYDYSDVQIAINGVLLMVVGTIGAILFSLYIKKTFNYRKPLRVASIGATVASFILCIWLNTANVKPVTSIVLSVMGFLTTPLVPICYDLGCELAFPIGEAQVTGLLNGGALFWAFISSTFVTSVFGYGSTKSSLIIIIILSVFVLIAAVLFFFVKIDLKRHNFEKEQHNKPHITEMTQKTEPAKQAERVQEQFPSKTSNVSGQSKQYNELVEEHVGAQNQDIL